ncbi:hypothetical protein LS482_15640 [Sinomicrobium kalidii]|uniref:hypothetical protein n=1 Tax=Sinomicrobium kalidii TaxID=2900738 RepID=UPI001E2867D6|nr:hypothetical protein [Sinomicrobium kalidii]UGU15106.1 hypothetical protein LS482_15640 [Sinomicrobium kalidii]
MMSYNDPHKEELIRKAVKESGPEKPSPDFVHHVMQRVGGEQEQLPYKPLISGSGWGIIAAVTTGIVLLSLFFTTEWNWTVDLSFLSFLKVSVNTSLWFSIGVILLLILVQIPILKIYHNRKMSGV